MEGGHIIPVVGDRPGLGRQQRGSLLLFPDPRDVPPQAFVGQQQFASVVSLGQHALVGDQVVDTVVAQSADEQLAALHLALAEAGHELFAAMDGARQQVVLGERFGPATEIAAGRRWNNCWNARSLSRFPHAGILRRPSSLAALTPKLTGLARWRGLI